MSERCSCDKGCGLSQMKDLLDIIEGLRRELEVARQESCKMEMQRINAEAWAEAYKNRIEEAERKAKNTRHGTWTYQRSKLMAYRRKNMTCSCCQSTFTCPIGRNYEYCPACGAKMEVSK